MGYTTDFEGQIKIDPPLNQEEINFIQKFNETRRMHRKNGPYFVEGTGFGGQGNDPDIIDNNRPDPTQPGLWCQWTVTDEGDFIEWDGGEKFYHADDWMIYIIDHFLKPDAYAKEKLPFLQANHVCNGMIEAQGEEPSDMWRLVVENNVVTKKHPTISWG